MGSSNSERYRWRLEPEANRTNQVTSSWTTLENAPLLDAPLAARMPGSIVNLRATSANHVAVRSLCHPRVTGLPEAV